MVLATFMLLYRTTLLVLLGESANKIVFAFSILLFIVGLLGLVLVIFNQIDYFLMWMFFALLVTFFMMFVFYFLMKFNNSQDK
ncbi:hypothetical protein ACF3NG_06495 [Aerococcaceae bacterium WGS1372]